MSDFPTYDAAARFVFLEKIDRDSDEVGYAIRDTILTFASSNAIDEDGKEAFGLRWAKPLHFPGWDYPGFEKVLQANIQKAKETGFHIAFNDNYCYYAVAPDGSVDSETTW